MDRAAAWKHLFLHWPEEVPHQGVLVTILGDQVPFESFLVSDQMVLLQRRAPDTMGARQVLLPFDRIDSLKIVDVVRPKAFAPLGFSGQTAKKP